ncbi:hypothetical protein LHJ74_14760 [Streptomyces sp. N2-109]|uniref:Tail assembly chaperone n=1 Tax=Streptomyces gossypii TaxID=2883101 RepID=A0ABT2JTY3_9ACTN|nr:hypothetical protein [Streptomyces gossypii]MCT2591153.1 hypothetical protein [Streptomyces gossypii]
MGYKRKRRTYDLDFTGTEDAGLQVRMGGLSVAEMLRIQGITEPTEDDERWGFELLASRLISWNLEEEEDGRPVPCTLDAILELDWDFVTRINEAWVDAIGGVSGPLESSSPAGGPSPVVQIPMAPLSPSPASWSAPNGSSGSAVPSTFSPAAS